jgi:O-antigen/teichoic acid export membrane protein
MEELPIEKPRKGIAAASRFATDTFETFVSIVGNMVINFLTGIVINRGLGPEGKGIYVGITIWVAILAWATNISFHLVTAYYIRKMPDQRSTVFTSLALVSFIFGLCASLFGEFLICPLLVQHNQLHDLTPVRLLFATIPISTVVQVINGALNGLFRFRFTNVARILMPFTLLVIWTILYFSRDMTVVTCLVSLSAVTVVYGVIEVIYVICLRLLTFNIDFKLIGSALAYGLKAHGATTSDIVSGSMTPVILSVMLSPVVLGYYSAAQSIAGAVGAFATAITTTGFPVLSSMVREAAHDTAMKIWRVSLVVVMPTAFFLALCLPWIIPIIYGRAFVEATAPSITMLLSVVLSGQANILRNALNSQGYTMISSTSEAVSLSVSFCAMLFLPRYFGAEGAAMAMVLGSISRLITLLVSYRRNIGTVSVNELLPHKPDVLWCYHTCASIVKRACASRLPA